MSLSKKLLGLITFALVGSAAPAALAAPEHRPSPQYQTQMEFGFNSHRRPMARRADRLERQGQEKILRGQALVREGRMYHRRSLVRRGESLIREGRLLLRQAAALQPGHRFVAFR